MNEGKISQVIGAVVDVEFEKQLPRIRDAMKIDEAGDPSKGIPEIHVTLEAAIHLGENKVRTLAMGATDGLVRGMKVVDTGQPITVPVGNATLGRLINVLGEPIDELGPVKCEERWAIHRDAPSLEDQKTSWEILETGIKVIDLLTPYPKGGKIGLFGGAGGGRPALSARLPRNTAP